MFDNGTGYVRDEGRMVEGEEIIFLYTREFVSLGEKLADVIKIMKTDKSIKPKRLIKAKPAWVDDRVIRRNIKFHFKIFLGIARERYIYISNAGPVK